MSWPDILVGGAIGVAVTIAGGYLFYRLDARRSVPRLAFRSYSSTIAHRPDQASSGDIEIRFRGSVIPQLTRTRLAIWNPGWSIVESQRVAAGDRLEFSFRDGAILEVETLKASREAVQFRTSVEEGRCAFMFDFLDHDDGVVLDVLHTAGEITPTFTGTLKGMPAGIRNYGLLIPEIRTVWGGIGLGFTVATTGLMVLVVANSLSLSGWGLIILAAAIGVGALSFVGIAVMRQQERTLPVSLRLPPQS